MCLSFSWYDNKHLINILLSLFLPIQNAFLLRPIILVFHQKAQKCTYGPNTIKLNGFYYYINLIRRHISLTTKTCIYSYCLLGCTLNDLKVLRERARERETQSLSGRLCLCLSIFSSSPHYRHGVTDAHCLFLIEDLVAHRYSSMVRKWKTRGHWLSYRQHIYLREADWGCSAPCQLPNAHGPCNRQNNVLRCTDWTQSYMWVHSVMFETSPLFSISPPATTCFKTPACFLGC